MPAGIFGKSWVAGLWVLDGSWSALNGIAKLRTPRAIGGRVSRSWHQRHTYSGNRASAATFSMAVASGIAHLNAFGTPCSTAGFGRNYDNAACGPRAI